MNESVVIGWALSTDKLVDALVSNPPMKASRNLMSIKIVRH